MAASINTAMEFATNSVLWGSTNDPDTDIVLLGVAACTLRRLQEDLTLATDLRLRAKYSSMSDDDTIHPHDYLPSLAEIYDFMSRVTSRAKNSPTRHAVAVIAHGGTPAPPTQELSKPPHIHHTLTRSLHLSRRRLEE